MGTLAHGRVVASRTRDDSISLNVSVTAATGTLGDKTLANIGSVAAIGTPGSSIMFRNTASISGTLADGILVNGVRVGT